MLSSVLISIGFSLAFQVLRSPEERSAFQADETRNTTGCLHHFISNPNHFSKCKSNVCFLFVSEKPFVFLDPRMEAENNQTLFRCSRRGSIFPGLRGISFRIKDELLLDDALCVFAGTQCTFDNMVDFVVEHAASPGGHQFAIAGLMFILPHRISRRIRPSVPIVEGNLLILGPRNPSSHNAGVWRTLLQPFERNSWIMLGSVLLFLLALSILSFWIFSEKHTWSNYVRSLLGDATIGLKSVEECSPGERRWRRKLHEEKTLANKVAFVSLGVAVASLLAISILFYEIAIVNYVFVQQLKELGKDVKKLTARDLSKYIIMEGGAQEFVWRKIVDPNRRFASGPFPWHNCGHIDDCYEKLLDNNHPADYMMTYDLDVRYHLQNQTLCDSFTVYKTERPLFSFNWGWYYGANVLPDTSIRIDREISTLRLNDKMRAIFAEELDTSDSPDCRKPSQSIGVDIVGPMIAVFVGLFALIALGALVRGYQIREKEKIGYQEEVQADNN